LNGLFEFISGGLFIQNLTTNTTIADITGKKMSALAVFSNLLVYIKHHALNRLQSRDTNFTLGENDIHWVVTVPAIWNDKAKVFMRRAMSKV